MMKTQLAMTFAGAGLLAAGSAQAAFTPVLEPADSPEPTHEEILEAVFGGDFVANGLDFSSGDIQVTRIDDSNDQTFEFLQWSAQALVSWAGAEQSFGTSAGGSLFDAVGMNGPVTGSTGSQPGGSDIAFARFGDDFDTLDVSTDPTLNPDGVDFAVTYQVTTLSNEQALQAPELTYLIFFEDSNETSVFTDFDYNDLVVEVNGSVIPEPSSLALLAIGGLAMYRRRR